VFENESPAESRNSGTFDWKIDRPAAPKRDVSVLKAVGTSAGNDAADNDGVTKIRLTVGSTVDTAWQNSGVRQASAQESVTESTGWKRAEK
jgi:hypothetical protein